jgi:hypothetical protein
MESLQRVFANQTSSKAVNDIAASAGEGPTGDHEVTVETTCRDGETRIDIAVLARARPWAQAHVVILSQGADDHQVFAAFGVGAMAVALPVDLPEQEASNAAAETAIAELMPDVAPTLIAALRDRWQAEHDRLTDRWAHLERMGYCADRLELFHGPQQDVPVIRYRTTRPGQDELFGVMYQPTTRKYEALRDYSEKLGQFVAITQQALAGVSTLSGHEKLELLAGANGAEQARAREAFDNSRTPGRNVMCRPLIGLDGVCIGNRVYFNNGDTGFFSASVHDSGRGHLLIDLTLSSRRSTIRVEGDSDGQLTIGRGKHRENRFKSPEALDECLGELLDFNLAMDQVLPAVLLPPKPVSFRHDHPVLVGRTIPPRHQPFVAALLDKPYAKARKAAERAAAIEAKKQGKAEAVGDLAAEIADGAMFGTVRFAADGDMSEYGGRMRFMKLGLVRSDIGPNGKRNRQIKGLAGFSTARPLTPKNMARLPLLTDPNALSVVSDVCLGDKYRDVVEGAFRLSFHLDGGAANPLLAPVSKIDFVASDQDDTSLRVTTAQVPEGPMLAAFSVTFPDRDMFFDFHLTGAGFMALRIGDVYHFSARPELSWHGLAAPDAHRRLIEQTLTKFAATGGWVPDTMLSGLDAAWTAMAAAIVTDAR